MDTTTSELRFGSAVLDIEQRKLLIDKKPAKLGARAFSVLVALIERRDRTVGKNELFELVWPGLVVEENNLQVHISALRKLLGPQAIATIPGRGYRFTPPLDTSEPAPIVSGETPPSIAEPRSEPGMAGRTNLPERMPMLFGREADVAAVKSALANNPLVTVAGAGGIGKTRLGQLAASDARPDFPDGVWWVEFAALSDGALVPAAVAQVLGIQQADGRDFTQSIIAVARAQRLLLVLDNCEHVLDAVAAFAAAVLAAAPRVQLLVTSQEVLKLASESVYRLGPLALPGDDALATVRASGACALFVVRAQAADRRFELTADTVGAVVEICRRLDGIPLAIELAAARVPMLGVKVLQSKLNERFKLLTGGARVVLRRHQTLRAALEWSCGLLSADEQAVFRRLGVFAGGFTLSLVQRVVTDESIDEWSALDLLANLVDKSLVMVEGGIEPRYRLLETTRAYATELLAASGETHAWLGRHAKAMLERLDAAEELRIRGVPDDGIGAELDNVRAALDWSLGEGIDRRIAVELHAASMTVWRALALMAEGAERCRAVLPWLDETIPEPIVARYWLTVAMQGIFSSRLESFEAAARAAEMYRTLGVASLEYDALIVRAAVGARRGQHAIASTAITRAQSLIEPNWPPSRRSALAFAAWLNAARAGNMEEALQHAQRQATLFREANNAAGEAIALGNAGDAELGIAGLEATGQARLRDAHARLVSLGREAHAGHIAYSLVIALLLRDAKEEALDQARLALRLLRREGDQGLLITVLPLLAARRGALEIAARVSGFAAMADAREGIPSRAVQIEATALLKESLPAERYELLVREGASLNEDEAFSLVLDAPDRQSG